MDKIAILIPCLNEELTIGKVIDDFKQTVPEAEIFVCDNGSTDNTFQIAKSKGVNVISQPLRGKGRAVDKLFRTVNADIYILIDGDDTYDVKDVTQLITTIKNGADMVVADRLSGSYFEENKRLFHNNGNKTVRWFVNFLFKSDLHDIMSGYRAFTKDFVSNFPITSKGFEIETELTIHALYYDYNVKEIVSNYKDRPTGSESKLNTLKDGIKVLKTIFNLFRNYRPLAFFSTLSAILALPAILMFISVFYEYLNTGLVPRFPTLFVSCFLLLSSIISFFTGMILEVQRQNTLKITKLISQIRL